MTISFSGLASGLDTSSWVQSLTALKRAKVTALEDKKSEVEVTRDTLNNIKSFFSSFRSTLEKITDSKFGIQSLDLFSKKLASSSDERVLNAVATSEAEAATYEITVDKLATATKAKSGIAQTVEQSVLASKETKLSEIGVFSGDIYVNAAGKESIINISSNETIGSFAEKLKNAGASADYDESTGIFSLNLYGGSINDIGSTNVIEAFCLQDVGQTYAAGTFYTNTTETITVHATANTKLSELEVTNGSLHVNKDGTVTDIIIDTNTKIQDLIDTGLFEFNNGVLSVNDATITATDTNFLSKLGFEAVSNSEYVSSNSLSYEISTVSIVTGITEDTLLSDLGLNEGSMVVSVYNNSDNTTNYFTIRSNDTIGTMFSKMSDCGYTSLAIDNNRIILGGEHLEVSKNFADFLGLSSISASNYNHTITTSNFSLICAVTVDGSTTLAEAGFNITSSNNKLYVQNGSTTTRYKTITVTGSTTFDSIISQVNSVSGCNLTLEDGVLRMDSSDTALSSTKRLTGTFATLLGMTTASSTNTVTTTSTVNKTVTNTISTTTTIFNNNLATEAMITIPKQSDNGVTYTSGAPSGFISPIHSISITGLTELSDISSLTSGQTYKITTTSSLMKLASLCEDDIHSGAGCTFVLGANLTFSQTIDEFKGTFYGNGYGLTSQGNPFINKMQDGSIFDLRISYNKAGNTIDGSAWGILANSASASTINNVYVTAGTINLTVNSANTYVGLLIGTTSGSQIYNSYASANINVKNGKCTLGGLVGDASYGLTIDNCYAQGTFSATSSSTMGGLFGSIGHDADIMNSYYAGTLKGSVENAGGVIGECINNDYTIVINNCYTSLVTTDTSSFVGGIIGNATGSAAQIRNCSYLYNHPAYSAQGSGVITANLTAYGATITSSTTFGELGLPSNAIKYSVFRYNGQNVGTITVSSTTTIGEYAQLINNSNNYTYAELNNGYFTISPNYYDESEYRGLTVDSTIANLLHFYGSSNYTENTTTTTTITTTSTTSVTTTKIVQTVSSAVLPSMSQQVEATAQVVTSLSDNQIVIKNTITGATTTVTATISNGSIVLDSDAQLLRVSQNINNSYGSSSTTTTFVVSPTYMSDSEDKSGVINYSVASAATTFAELGIDTSSPINVYSSYDLLLGSFSVTQSSTLQDFLNSINAINTSADARISNGVVLIQNGYITGSIARALGINHEDSEIADYSGLFMNTFEQVTELEPDTNYVRDGITYRVVSTSDGLINAIDQNLNIILSDDIDMENSSWDGYFMSYGRIFDGNGHVISNVQIDPTRTTSNIGFIDNLNSGGAIINLGLCNVSIASSESRCYTSAGILVGQNDGCIDNCFILNSDISAISSSGGVAGRIGAGGEVSYTRVYNSNVSGELAGGITGYMTSGALMYDCEVYNAVLSANQGDSYAAGGIVGYATDEAYISGCNVYNPALHGGLHAGFIFGYKSENAVISDCNVYDNIYFSNTLRVPQTVSTIGTQTAVGTNYISVISDVTEFSFRLGDTNYNHVIQENETINDFVNYLDGIDGLNAWFSDGKIHLKSQGLPLTITQGGELADLGSPVTTYNYSTPDNGSTLSKQTVNTTTSVATTASKIKNLNNYGFGLDGTIAFKIDGESKNITIEQEDTIGNVIQKLHSIGLNAGFNNGILKIYDLDSAAEIDTANSGSAISGKYNGMPLGLTLTANSGMMQNKNRLEYNINVNQNLSVSNYADLDTALSVVGITSGTLTIYDNGKKCVINIDENDTFDEFNTKLKNIQSDLEMTLTDGYLNIFSTTGNDVLISSLNDTSNFLSALSIEQNNGKVESTRLLYKVNDSTQVTASNIFRKGDITEGTFIVGEEEITITSSTTINDIINAINYSEKSMATAHWDNWRGELVIESKQTGSSLINIEAGTSNFTDVMGLTLDSERLNTSLQTLGQNAQFTINGNKKTAVSNTIMSDVSGIKGVTLNLNSISEGNTVTVTIEEDTQTISDAVSDVVNAYNELLNNIDEAVKSEGKLKNQSVLKMIRNQLKSLMSNTASYNSMSLSSIGISVNEATGGNISTSGLDLLNFDKDKFASVYKKSPAEMKNFLVGDSDDGVFSRVEALIESTLSSNGMFYIQENSYNKQISQLNEKITKANSAVNRYQEMLSNKFSAMDMLISKIQQSYSTFLTT